MLLITNLCICIKQPRLCGGNMLLAVLRCYILDYTVFSSVQCTQWAFVCQQRAVFIRLSDHPDSRNSGPIQSTNGVWLCRKRICTAHRKEIVQMENDISDVALIPSDYQRHSKHVVTFSIRKVCFTLGIIQKVVQILRSRRIRPVSRSNYEKRA